PQEAHRGGAGCGASIGRRWYGRYRDNPRRRSVERREAQAPTSLGLRIPGGGPRWARPSCAGRLLRKESAKGASQAPMGSRKPLAPPGAPSPRFGEERKKGMGVPVARNKEHGPRSVG